MREEQTRYGWRRDTDVGKGEGRERTTGYSISFVAVRERERKRDGERASARADFRSMKQLTAETQGSSGSET